MSLSIRFNGFDFEGFIEAEVERDIETVASTFSFTATSSRDKFLPIREGDLIEVIADDIKVLTGRVDVYDLEYDSKTHITTISGRSLTGDIVDTTVGATKVFENVGFLDLCERNVKEFGIKVVNEAGPFRDFDDIDSAETGQKIFEFLESFARKRQVLLTDNENGNLVITRASGTLSPNSLKNKIGESDNNIISGGRRINISELYNEYRAVSQLDPVNLDLLSTLLPAELVDEIGITFDREIRFPRRLEFYTEETTDSFTLEDRARWEMSIRRARNFEYKAVVQGHSFNGLVWKPNILHQIDDDFARVFGQFLCKRVKYLFSLKTGSTTELIFTSKNAYTLQSEKDKIIIEFEEFG